MELILDYDEDTTDVFGLWVWVKLACTTTFQVGLQDAQAKLKERYLGGNMQARLHEATGVLQHSRSAKI